jgi:hypothetical protein
MTWATATKLVWKPASFVISIVLMAGVYEAIWTGRPDYFRVSPDVNFLPIDLIEIARAYSGVTSDKPLPNLLRPQDESAIEKIKSLYQSAQTASVRLAEKQKELAHVIEQDELGYKAFEDSQWSQVDAYIAKKVGAYQSEVAKLDEQLRQMLERAAVKSSDELPAGPSAVAYSQLAVVRARAAFEAAKAEVEARDYTLKHLTEFQGTPTQQTYIASHLETERLRKEVFAIQDGIVATRGNLYDAMVKYLREAHDSLTYWDFLYFSVGAATTATFGDIAPNHKSVRLLVCLQVVLSIVFVGLMVNEIAARHGRQ